MVGLFAEEELQGQERQRNETEQIVYGASKDEEASRLVDQQVSETVWSRYRFI